MFQKEALGNNAVFRCHKRFAQGRDSLEDDKHTVRIMVRTELKIQDDSMLVCANCSQMVHEDAAVVAAGTSHHTCHKILSNGLNMSRVTQHSVPRVLTQYPHDDRMSTCGDLIDSADKDGTFLNWIICSRRQNMVFSALSTTEVKLSHLEIAITTKKEETVTGQVKWQVMLEQFFNSSGIVHTEFIPKGVTVNKHCYKEILHHLCNSIHHEHPELWNRKNSLLLHDNAPAHRSVLDQVELAKQQVTTPPIPT
jgi:hypothetical protein